MIEAIKVNVSKDIFNGVLNQIGIHEGRCMGEDVDKDLEISLCKLFFKNAKEIIPSDKNLDLNDKIDCIVDGVPVQIKCRSKDRLYLEDFKIRHYNKIPGWLNNCKSELFLWVYPSSVGCLVGRIMKKETVKFLLNICRKFHNNEHIEDETEIINLLGKDWKSKIFYREETSVDEIGDGRGNFFEIIL